MFWIAAARRRSNRFFRVPMLLDEGTVHVAAVDVELDEAEALVLNSLGYRCGPLFLWTVRWSNRAGDDDGQFKIPCDVFRVAVEAL